MLGHSLRLCATESGLNYKKTSVEGAKSVRQIIMQLVYDYILQAPLKFHGTVEIDESLFGRKVKAHRGDPNKGKRVWIVGLIERATNRIILYPVEN